MCPRPATAQRLVTTKKPHLRVREVGRLSLTFSFPAGFNPIRSTICRNALRARQTAKPSEGEVILPVVRRGCLGYTTKQRQQNRGGACRGGSTPYISPKIEAGNQ